MRRKPSESGFTLIEVMVALSILTIGIIGIVSLFSGSLRSINRSAEARDLGMIAMSEMRTVLLNPDLAESENDESREGYHLFYSIREVEDERFQNLPYKLYDITLKVTRAGKSFSLRSRKLIRTLGK